MQITPPQRVGCFKHWHMIQHTWSVQGEWATEDAMAILTVDYNHAFPVLSHTFTRAVLVFIQLLHGFVDLVLSSLLCCYYFLLGNSITKLHILQPKAGIGQGEVFSPLLFSFCASFLIFPLNHTLGGVGIYRYVYDLLVTVPHKGMGTAVAYVMHHLNRFSAIYGVHINLSKSALLLKGDVGQDSLRQLKEARLQQLSFVRF